MATVPLLSSVARRHCTRAFVGPTGVFLAGCANFPKMTQELYRLMWVMVDKQMFRNRALDAPRT
jgi:hypothetical protein